MLIFIEISSSLKECSLEAIMSVLPMSSLELFVDSFRRPTIASAVATMMEPVEIIPREYFVGNMFAQLLLLPFDHEVFVSVCVSHQIRKSFLSPWYRSYLCELG